MPNFTNLSEQLTKFKHENHAKLRKFSPKSCEILNTKFAQLFRKIRRGDLNFCDGSYRVGNDRAKI